MARRIEREMASLQRQVSKQRKQPVAPDPLIDEDAFLEWHEQQLTPRERAERDAILKPLLDELNAAAPVQSDTRDFDVVTDQQEVKPSDHHFSGCQCFTCIQRRAMHRRIGLI